MRCCPAWSSAASCMAHRLDLLLAGQDFLAVQHRGCTHDILREAPCCHCWFIGNNKRQVCLLASCTQRGIDTCAARKPPACHTSSMQDMIVCLHPAESNNFAHACVAALELGCSCSITSKLLLTDTRVSFHCFGGIPARPSTACLLQAVPAEPA